MKCADRLVLFFSEDMYPPLEEETIYGIEMGTGSDTHQYIGIDYPIGKLMYSAWKFLYFAFVEFECGSGNEEEEHEEEQERYKKAAKLFKYEFANAMLAGKLLSGLKEKIEKYHDRWERKFGNDAYVEELRCRDYKGITWNYGVHQNVKIWPDLDPTKPHPVMDVTYWLGQDNQATPRF